MDKKELRNKIRNMKRQFTSEELGELSLTVISRLKKHYAFRNSHTVLLYYSMPDEVNTHKLVDEMILEGKKVLLPVVTDNENMEIREYHSKDDLIEGSAYHIMEPVGKRFENYKEIELAIIPGMSFDQKGNRLGRGKGYYDRFLSKIPSAYKIGICFDFQKTTEVPTEPTDIKVDEVI